MVTHGVVRYKDILLPYPYLQQNFKYDIHEVLQNVYRFQIFNLIIRQTFCFLHCGFYIWGVWDDDHTMLTSKNVYFWQICNIHNHTQICIGQSSSWFGVVIFYVRLNHWWKLYLFHILPPSVPLSKVETPCYYVVLWPIFQ